MNFKIHKFEADPIKRKRTESKLVRQLLKIVDELRIRVGHQVVICTMRDASNNREATKRKFSLKVMGSEPLRQVMKEISDTIINRYEEYTTYIQQAHSYVVKEDPNLFKLPELEINGDYYTLDKMSQAHLRAFIPLMLKYSLGRGKPGWGKAPMKPPWWPEEVPWVNVRMDMRTVQAKQTLSWTECLRKVIYRCYKYHGREDLLEGVTEETLVTKVVKIEDNEEEQQPEYVLKGSLENTDGNVSIVCTEPGNPNMVKLPDGTYAIIEIIDMDQEFEITL